MNSTVSPDLETLACITRLTCCCIMIVHAAESLYWFNTTEPPYLICITKVVGWTWCQISRKKVLRYTNPKIITKIVKLGPDSTFISAEIFDSVY